MNGDGGKADIIAAITDDLAGEAIGNPQLLAAYLALGAVARAQGERHDDHRERDRAKEVAGATPEDCSDVESLARALALAAVQRSPQNPSA